MTRPTARGISLLVVSVVTYVAARILGEWELYLVAFAFLVSVGVAWAFVAATGRRLGLRRSVEPAQPVAGDPLQLTFRVQNGSLLPGLQVTLVDADGALGGGGGPLELDSLGSRSARVATSGPWPARRGVHHLTDQLALAEDPMGLVRTRRSLGGTLDVTVVPRLTRLPSCSLLADATVRRGGGRRPRRALDASEFHGIRPHNPGEPLNRVDWKATAKTGSLMLREMEDVTDGGAVLLLNGLAPGATGPQAEADFETAVQVAGSVADYALRSGRPAVLLLPDNDLRPVRLSANAKNRRRLLTILAAATQRGLTRLGPSLKALAADGRPLARAESLTLVVLSLDSDLVRVLTGLRAAGLPVAVVHVAERAGAPASTASVSGAESAELRYALSAAGVRYIGVGRHDDLRAALSGRPESRYAGVR